MSVRGTTRSWLWVVFTLAFAVAACVLFSRAAGPRVRLAPVKATGRVEADQVVGQVTAETVRQHLTALASTPSRMPGTEGFTRSAAYIRETFRSLGMEVREQRFEVVVPVTKFCEVFDTLGLLVARYSGSQTFVNIPFPRRRAQPIPGVRLYPFWPNWVRTCTTPPNGITGRVLRRGDGTGRLTDYDGVDPSTSIPLLRLSAETDWIALADAGFPAVLFYHDDRALPEDYRTKELDFPANFPRFLVTGDVDGLLNREVTLSCRVDMESVPVSNIIGILDPGRPQRTKEALLLAAHYDAISPVPDLAPGADEVAGMVGLLEAARVASKYQKSSARTLLFVALAANGEASLSSRRLADLWGGQGAEHLRLARWNQEVAQLDASLRLLRNELSVVNDDAYWIVRGDVRANREAEADEWRRRGREVEDALTDDVRRIVEEDIHPAQERMIRGKLAWEREGRRPDSSAWRAYDRARIKVDKLRVVSSSHLLGMRLYHAEYVRKAKVRERTEKRLRAKQRFVAEELSAARESRSIARRLARFDRHLLVALSLSSESPRLMILSGYEAARRSLEGLTAEIVSEGQPFAAKFAPALPADPARSSDIRDLLVSGFTAIAGRSDGQLLPVPETVSQFGTGALPFYYDHHPFLGQGRQALLAATLASPRRKQGTPEDVPSTVRVDNLVFQCRVLASLFAQMAGGVVSFSLPKHRAGVKSLAGAVVQVGGEGTVVPTRGVENALVVSRWGTNPQVSSDLPQCHSVRQYDLAVTRFEGKFQFPGLTSRWSERATWAFRLDPLTGDLIGAADQGDKGEKAFPSRRGFTDLGNPLHLVLFRAAQTDVFYPIKPSNFEPVGNVLSVEQRTLAAPESYSVIGNPAHGFALFHDPATRFYAGLRSGSLVNPALESTVAFALNTTSASVAHQPPGREVWGEGYLAQDTPRLCPVLKQAARSMADLNGRRLERQLRHRVADPLVVTEDQIAQRLMRRGEARERQHRTVAAFLELARSLAYSMKVYPFVALTESDAVTGVLFYLMLLLPFAFFMERLLFGFPDLRPQLAGVFGIFLAVFLLLRHLHPAYELVSSPLIVLLGFLTFALSLFVTVFLFGKFRENMDRLRRQLHGQAVAADVSRMAAAATAFTLGINNMRKRKVRTGFTCVTLVLITFTLLSLTSMRGEQEWRRIVLGPSPYRGLALRSRNYKPLQGHARAVQMYGSKFRVVPLYSRFPAYYAPNYLPLPIERIVNGRTASYETLGVIGVDIREDGLTHVTSALTTPKAWFRSNEEAACFLPQPAAAPLGLTLEAIRSGTATVRLEGEAFRVLGLFDPGKLERLYDLDGETLLPVDGVAAAKAGRGPVGAAAVQTGGQLQRPPKALTVPADKTVIMPYRRCRGDLVRVAVDMSGVRASEAMAAIEDFIDRVGQYVYYSIGGVSFYGGRVRSSQLRGFAEVLVPILIAAAIVLNTMLGSVYERSQEIQVYSAVGLSPTHVRYLFLAEAAVYAIVGAVAGYLLSQALGAGLSSMGVTRGLSMNYSAMTTIYATIAVMAAVFLSTVFPARKAARIAAPSEVVTIQVPEPEGDRIELRLPFTYVELDALSAAPFLYSVFEQHGEGSAGEFFCADPELLSETEEGGRTAFGVGALCWLKPYDLGVSQRVAIFIRPSQHEGVYFAHLRMDRVTGDVSSWRRTNVLFLGYLRQQFLAWRAVTDAEKEEFLIRGLAAYNVSVDQYLSEEPEEVTTDA